MGHWSPLDSLGHVLKLDVRGSLATKRACSKEGGSHEPLLLSCCRLA